MDKQTARAITGGLSKPSKMPCPSYSVECPRWGTDAECKYCYARKGMYGFRCVREAIQRRTDSLWGPRWAEAMVTLIDNRPHFRWHDAGDLRTIAHLGRIIAVCKQTPDTAHWLPTQRRDLIEKWKQIGGHFPPNLCIRVSSGGVDTAPGNSGCTSSIHFRKHPVGFECPAQTTDGHCADCRACWDRNVANVSYRLH